MKRRLAVGARLEHARDSETESSTEDVSSLSSSSDVSVEVNHVAELLPGVTLEVYRYGITLNW